MSRRHTAPRPAQAAQARTAPQTTTHPISDRSTADGDGDDKESGLDPAHSSATHESRPLFEQAPATASDLIRQLSHRPITQSCRLATHAAVRLACPHVRPSRPAQPSRRRAHPPSDSGSIRTAPDATESAPGPSVLCGACSAFIARVQDAIAVAGQHSHVCVNPDGIAFDIACYRHAAGCRQLGEPQAFWSWFAGYGWRFALCASCGIHLGWGFLGDRDHFFGLIRDRLRLMSE